MKRIPLAFFGLTLLISSNAWADLRAFEVDFQYRQEVLEALRGVLVDNPNIAREGFAAYGHVELLPGGQILVEAAPETLVQIDAVIRSISARPVVATPRVSLRYWAVLGSRAQGNVGDEIGTPVPSVLNDVLAELERMHGDLTFRVIGTAALATESGQEGEISGPTLSVAQTAYVQSDTLNADIRMVLQGVVGPAGPAADSSIGNLSVRTTLGRGQFVVVGENAVRGGGLDGPVFYIVHWPPNE
jgi:hypothetical protein